MVEKLIKGVENAKTNKELDRLATYGIEAWLADTLSDEDYEVFKVAVEKATERLTPKTVAETTLPTPPSNPTLPRDICQRCKAPLSNYQIMMGTLICVECDRRARNRAA